MMGPLLYRALPVLFLAVFGLTLRPKAGIGAIFEPDDFKHNSLVFNKTFEDNILLQRKNISLHTLTFRWDGPLYELFRELCTVVEERDIRVLLVVGSRSTLQAVGQVAAPLGIPIVGYTTDKAVDKYVQIHNPLLLMMKPSKIDQAQAFLQFFQANFWFNMIIIVQDKFIVDGFYDHMRINSSQPKWNIHAEILIHNPLLLMMKPSKIDQAQAFLQFFQANFWFNMIIIVQDKFIVDGFYDHMRINSSQPKWNIHAEIISEETPRMDLLKILLSQLGNEPKIVVIHTDLEIAVKLFTLAKEANLTAINHAWFVTETSYSRELEELEAFPAGTMAIIPNYAVRVDDVIVDGSNFMIKSVISMLKKRPSIKRSCWGANLDVYKSQGDFMYSHMVKTKMTGLSGDILFDEEGQLESYGFVVLNLVHEESQRFWRKTGHVKGDDVSPFGIIWPGESLSSNVLQGRKKYRVVTNPVKPFMVDEYPHSDYGSCAKDTTCISMINQKASKVMIIQAIQDYENGIMNETNPYEIKCCRGLSVDLLNRLASDLDFDYSLYITPDRTYGKEINGTWNGMVRDLMQGTAHMAVAAFSITRERVKVIDFTSPYFFSGFSVLYTEKQRASNMQAFLEPFDPPVWFAIFISATFTAIAMGIFEWKSPFGLNPWGKKRKQNYTLASGMTMVYSVLFGHTVKTKSPKAWPSKVMQNFWAFCCIFVIASYTANLAAFIAGKHAGITYNNIHDSRLLDINVGVLPGSAVAGTVKKLNYKLFKKCHPQNATDNAIKKIIYGGLDAYLGDYPILDYARSKLDPDCDLRMLTQNFGEDGYGIALPKGSPIKLPLSKKIQEFHEGGFVEDLIDVHFADSLCYKQRIKQEDSRLVVQHHAGSFVMLCVGIIVGIMILFLEHAIFKWLVPSLRKRPGSSKWKSVHVMFMSQRLHRAITSAELVPAHETCRELLGIVKNREFMRLFQKSTIKTDKMADAAKRKRLNRNFFDVIEKAKWMKEMNDNNLFGDDSTSEGAAPAPHIKEISLRDITQAVDLTEFRRQNHINTALTGASVSLPTKETNVDSNNSGGININATAHQNQTLTPAPDDDNCKPPPRYDSVVDISPDDNSADSLLPDINKTRVDKSTGLEYSAVPVDTAADEDRFSYASNVFEREASVDVVDEKETAFGGGGVGGGGKDNIYDVIDKGEHHTELELATVIVPPPPRVPNGDLLSAGGDYRPHRLCLSTPRHGGVFTTDNMGNGKSSSSSSSLSRHASMSAAKFKDSRTFHPRKRQSVHGNRRENANTKFDVDKFSKEELLLMWKSSELELSEKLEAAQKDKHRLESKLSAMRIQTSTPV